jgi:predicted nucleic acid-binding protein
MRERNREIRGPATRKLESLGKTRIYASIFVLCELQAGARLSDNPQRELRRVNILFDLLTVVYPDRSFAVSYGEAESSLRKKGGSIPTMDLLIGVAAKIAGRPLLTRDTRHFKRIPGLIIEDY